MAYEQKEFEGNLFPNEYKTTDKHPDFKGTCLMDGVLKEIALWEKDPDNKARFKFKIQDKRQKQDAPAQPTISQQAQAKVRRPDPISSGKSLYANNSDMGGDDIPF